MEPVGTGIALTNIRMDTKGKKRIRGWMAGQEPGRKGKAVVNMRKIAIITMALIMGWTILGSRASEARESNEFDAPVPWVSDINGPDNSLMIRQPDTDWFEATVNTPIGEGDMLWQDRPGRSEIYIDRGTYLRLDRESGLRFDRLSNDEVRAVVTRGTVEAKNGMDADVLLDTPGLTVVVSRGGRARVTVAEDGVTEVAAKRGRVMADGPEGLIRVNAGQTLLTDPDGRIVRLSRGIDDKEFDRWSDLRNGAIARAAVPPTTVVTYLPEPVVLDMSLHGVWTNNPEYGWVWYPHVAVGWAPYRVGKWVYRPVWGWTWVSYEPWGWYPHHYGRWVLVGGNWAWVPLRVRAAWSPGLVFWIEGPDYYAWYPMPVGVSLSMVVNLGPDVIVHRYCHADYITVVSYNHFHHGHYNRYVEPWHRHSHVTYNVVRSPQGPTVRHMDVTYRTPTSRGYVTGNRVPREQVVYAHRSVQGSSQAARVDYGSRSIGQRGNVQADNNRTQPRPTTADRVQGSSMGRPDTSQGRVPDVRGSSSRQSSADRSVAPSSRGNDNKPDYRPTTRSGSQGESNRGGSVDRPSPAQGRESAPAKVNRGNSGSYGNSKNPSQTQPRESAPANVNGGSNGRSSGSRSETKSGGSSSGSSKQSVSPSRSSGSSSKSSVNTSRSSSSSHKSSKSSSSSSRKSSSRGSGKKPR